MSSTVSKTQTISLFGFVMMFFTSILGFANISRGIFYMGQASILFYIITGILFFLPYAIICAEMGASFKNEHGGIYSWISNSIGGTFGRKLAFITIFMWWFSYVTWMVSVSATVTIPISYIMSPFIDGGFANATKFVQQILGPTSMGIIGIILMTIITYCISMGIKSITKIAAIGGIAMMSLNLILLLCSMLIWAHNDFHSVSNYSFQTMTTSPLDSKYTESGGFLHIVSLLGFAVYAIFAYGGVEAVGGLVDKLENPEKDGKRGLLIGAFVGIFVYCVGILATSLVINRNSPEILHDILTPSQGGTGLYYTGNAVYYIMFKLGSGVGLALHLTQQHAILLGNIFAAYSGLAMFFSLSGALFVLTYSPIKQLIEGVPKGIFPAKLCKLNKNGIPANALFAQLALLVVIILADSTGGSAVKDLVQILITLANVALTIPIIFIIYSYIPYLKNDAIKKPIRIFKSTKVSFILAWSAIIMIVFANIFTIANPIILAFHGQDVHANIKEAITSCGGVILFAVIGWLLINRHERKSNK